MERLTLACLQHLPTAVLFVADLTGECGTTVGNQWAIRRVPSSAEQRLMKRWDGGTHWNRSPKLPTLPRT